MNETHLNEKESLEVISTMIRVSQKNLAKGTANTFLVMGYCSTIISLIIYVLLITTGNPLAHTLWSLLLFAAVYLYIKNRNYKPAVTTHIDSAITHIWNAVGFAMLGAVVIIVLNTYKQPQYFALMMPISLILIAMGSSVSSAVSKISKSASTAGLSFTIVVATNMLMDIAQDGKLSDNVFIVAAICFVILLILPGYKLRKIEKSNA